MLNRILILAAILSFSSTSFEQGRSWRSVDQNYYGMKYKLPKGWEVDGFGSSSVCDCAGTINIGDRFGKSELFMVVYPAMTKEELTSGKRLEVWDWEFKEKEDSLTYQSERLLFQKTISAWTPESCDDEDEKNLEVWRFITSDKGQHYVFYFWADPKTIHQHESTILKILNSFKATEVKEEEKRYW